MQAFLTRNSTVVAPLGGGYLNLVTLDGELLMQYAVPPGRSAANLYLREAGPRQRLVADEETGTLILDNPSRTMRQNVGEGHFESSANPSFRVTPQDRHLREQNARIHRLEAMEARLKAREQAVERATASGAGTDPQTGQPRSLAVSDDQEQQVTEPLEE